MEDQQTRDWQQARSRLYELFGDLLSRRPDKQTLDWLMGCDAVGYIEVLFDDPAVVTQYRKAAAQYENGVTGPDQIMLDFESLMRVPGPNYTHPYESSYLARVKGQRDAFWGGVFGEQTRKAERFFQSEGLTPRDEAVDYADHIAAELSFMAHLCRRAAEALEAGDRDMVDLMREKQRRFALEHLFIWVDDFSSQLKALSATSFYRALSEMLRAFTAMEKRELLNA